MVKGAEPVFEQAHVFFPELNPILSLLNFHQATVAGFVSNASADLNSTPGGQRVQSQIAIIDPNTSLTRYAKRPKWERGNSYLEPNALRRGLDLGTFESFDCKPEGGTLRNPVDAAPPAGPRRRAPAVLRGAAVAVQRQEVQLPAQGQLAQQVGAPGHGRQRPGHALTSRRTS